MGASSYHSQWCRITVVEGTPTFLFSLFNSSIGGSGCSGGGARFCKVILLTVVELLVYPHYPTLQ